MTNVLESVFSLGVGGNFWLDDEYTMYLIVGSSVHYLIPQRSTCLSGDQP